MIEKLIILILSSFVVSVSIIAIHKCFSEGMIFYPVRKWITYKICKCMDCKCAEWVQHPLWACPYCMSSVWGITLSLLIRVELVMIPFVILMACGWLVLFGRLLNWKAI